VTVGAAEKRDQLLALLAELQDVAADIGLAVEAQARDLSEGRLDELLAGALAVLARLRALQGQLPTESSPGG
jgi:hypothetical protein